MNFRSLTIAKVFSFCANFKHQEVIHAYELKSFKCVMEVYNQLSIKIGQGFQRQILFYEYSIVQIQNILKFVYQIINVKVFTFGLKCHSQIVYKNISRFCKENDFLMNF